MLNQENNAGGKTTDNNNTPQPKQGKPNKKTNIFVRVFNSPLCLPISTVALAIFTAALFSANFIVALDSKKQVNVVEKNMVVASAPYFMVKFTEVPLPVVGKDIFVSTLYTNVGKTPALKFRCLWAIYIDPQNSIHKMDIIPDSALVDIGMVPPNSSYEQNKRTTGAFTEKHINEIYSGQTITRNQPVG